MDERLAEIERQKNNALKKSDSTYDALIKENQNLYNQQQGYITQQEQLQNNVLNQQYELQRKQIENQKNEANLNYQTEQKRARNDYTSFINPYGVNAESQASQGLGQSGYSETVKLGGYNTYQNRLAAANKTLQDAITTYNLNMNEAKVNYDVQKAQNAVAKLQSMLQLSQNYYDKKSSLSQNKLNNNQSLNSDYFNRYNTVYQNIEQEKAKEEQIRQYNEQMAWEKQQYDSDLAWEREQYERNLALQKSKQEQELALQREQLAYQKERDRIADEQWQKEYALSQQSRSYSNNSYSSGSSSSGGYALTDSSQVDNSPQPVEQIKMNPTMTPMLSTGEYDWYNNTFGENSYTESELNQLIARGLSEGKLRDEDVNRILKAYGLS